MIEFPLRTHFDLSSGWSFKRRYVGRKWLSGRGSDGEIVDLPHCWNTQDTYQFGRRSYSGHGAYRVEFRVPALDRLAAGHFWRLSSEGFYGVGDLWLDGTKLGAFDGQYLGFYRDLEQPLDTCDHLLALRLDNRYHRNVLPGTPAPDFILHGGLTGRVGLQMIPEVHFDAERTTVRCVAMGEDEEEISLSCVVRNLSSCATGGQIQWRITDSNGSSIAVSSSISFSLEPWATSEPLTAAVTVRIPGTWSPDTPALLWAEARMTSADKPVDMIRIRFGVTRAEFKSGQGFFLDGARIDLHGCNRHEAIPGLGSAMPDELHRRDALLLKDYGFNLVRLSHYPQSPAFLDACDELGLMVYAEIATWKSVRSRRGWRRAACRQMRTMISRDRHHPSIILWGMGNESRSKKAYLQLRGIARELDPGRPVTYAENHLYRARRKGTIGLPDVWGINYELDVLEEARDSSRLECVILSECCNHPLSIKGDDREELAQVAVLETEWDVMAGHPFLAGHVVWSFADYATEYRDRFRRQTGLFDAWRKPKMAAELFRARFSQEPFVSLFPTRVDDESKLHIFTNCEQIRVVFDDSRTIELEESIHHVLDIGTPYSTIRVEGERNGQVARSLLRAWMPAVAIDIDVADDVIQPDMTIPVDLRVVDRDGTTVLDWNGHVTVTAEGNGRLLPYNDANQALIARGEGRIYVSLFAREGDVVVAATHDGLSAGTETICVPSPSSSGPDDQSLGS